MQKRISKKILLYLFILLLLGTPYNKKFSEIYLNKNYSFEISSLSEFDDTEIISDLLNFKYQNLLHWSVAKGASQEASGKLPSAVS